MPTRDSIAAYVHGGAMLAVTIPPPGAGVELDVVVPALREWRVHAASWVFTTSGVALPNRRVAVTMVVGGIICYATSFNLNQAGGLAIRYSVSAVADLKIPAFSIGGNVTAFPTPRVLPGDSALRTSTFGLDPGDTYGSIQLLVEQFIRSS